MDINLGKGINGEELTHIIRMNNDYKDIPIVAVTAFSDQDYRSALLSKGITNFIAKPFLMKDLLEVIDNVFK